MRQCPFLICAFLMLGVSFSLRARFGETVTHPIGLLVRVWDSDGPLPLPLQPSSRVLEIPKTPVEEINYLCALWDPNITPQTVPFDVRFAVTEVVPSQKLHFVRVYAPASGSGPNGCWIMRSDQIRGLTPEQIQNRFALPVLPTDIVNVELPAGMDPVTGKAYGLWTGIASPIPGFGSGGGVQTRIIADYNDTHYFPDYAFILGLREHPQLIGSYALSYRPMAGEGNHGRLADYLDQWIPGPYSDLERVYTDLDGLNWSGYGSQPLQDALSQISPDPYHSIPFVIMRNALLFSEEILDPKVHEEGCGSLSVKGATESARVRRQGLHPGFDYQTYGVLAELEGGSTDCFSVGMAAGGFYNQVHWQNQGGGANIASIKAGFDASYVSSVCFFDALLGGGYNWTQAHRNIAFSSMERRATSRLKAYDVEAHAQMGFTCGQNPVMVPLARASYFFIRQQKFCECDADSLNLQVESFNNQTLRTLLGCHFAYRVTIAHGDFLPELQLAWAHDFFLASRCLSASLAGLGGEFVNCGFLPDKDSLVVMTKLNIANGLGGEFWISYEGEFSRHLSANAATLTFNY